MTSADSENGFTLLEVLVSIVIFASVVTAVHYGTARATKAIRLADESTKALVVARSVLESYRQDEQVERITLKSGSIDGVDWHVDTQAYRRPNSDEETNDPPAYWITVTANWQSPSFGSAQFLSLKTLRIAQPQQ